MTLGERILQKRKECGLSQESLGEKLEVTRQTVYKWESDQAVPELDKLIKLAQIFGVGVGWLIAEEESNQKEQAYMEAAQRIAALLTQSQAQQPVRSEPVTEAAKAPTGKKINWFQVLAAAALVVILVVILAVGAFKFASIDREIANLGNTNQSSLSASSQNEEPLVFSAGPEQVPKIFTTETELTVYSTPYTTARTKGTIASGETVEILRTEHVGAHLWGFIQNQQAADTELTGWVNLDKTAMNPAAEDATETSQPEQDTQRISSEAELTVYSVPSTTARLVGTIAPGETAEVLKTENIGNHVWGFIQYQQADGTELTGWVNLDKTALNPAAKEATEASQSEQDTQRITTEAELTVYAFPSSESSPNGALASGETVEILRTASFVEARWGYIQHQLSDGTELSGWINLDEMEPEAEPTPTTTPDSTK